MLIIYNYDLYVKYYLMYYNHLQGDFSKDKDKFLRNIFRNEYQEKRKEIIFWYK